METKQTAVDWLMMQLPVFIRVDLYEKELYQQAKAMQKEQIINARIDGDENHTFNSQMREEYANDYYNETYGI